MLDYCSVQDLTRLHEAKIFSHTFAISTAGWAIERIKWLTDILTICYVLLTER